MWNRVSRLRSTNRHHRDTLGDARLRAEIVTIAVATKSPPEVANVKLEASAAL